MSDVREHERFAAHFATSSDTEVSHARERARVHLQQARNYPLSSQLGKYIETLEGDIAGSST